MRFTAVAFSFVAASATALACANSEDLAAECATLTDFCHTRARIECSQPIVSACHAKDQDTCVAQGEAACMKSVPQGTDYVPAAGPTCLQAVEATYATTTITADSLESMATACEPIFSGPGAARQPCTVDYDCSTKDGLRCLTPTGETEAKCLVPNPIDPGGPCPGEADVCSGPYFCSAQSKVCTAEGGEGSVCSIGYQPCMKGYVCPGGGPFQIMCQPLKPSGDPCTLASDCASNLCDKATGQAQGVCADQIQLTALDSLCAPYQ